MKGYKGIWKKGSAFLALLATSGVLLAPTANADSGLYLGGSIGQGVIEFTPGQVGGSFDESDTAWKGILGYNLDILLFDLAIEGSYFDLGNPTGDVLSNTVSIGMDGYTANVLAGFNLGPIGVFGKAGMVSWDSDIDILNVVTGTDSGTDPMYGVGARFSLMSAEVRAEFEFFDIEVEGLESSDFGMASVGVVWTF